MKVCNAKHTNTTTKPSPTARKKRCRCRKFHVWHEPPSKKRCGTCGAVRFLPNE